jgi:hypothetical protein
MRRYWIDCNPDAPTFDSPEEAIEDWIKDGYTIPSSVSWTEGDNEHAGCVGVQADDWQNGPYWLRGGTTYY